ncbi:hypothetical protein [Actinoplanes sp. NPDC089786]|uniref:hypothetical protein n=1 Tax=Actinoplanes sp. NPDC089786 TaxID=3155185 RepID=UPI0034373742
MSILIRLTLPSTGPELKGKLRPAVTAARSAVRPVAKRLMPGNAALLGCGDPRSETFAVQMGHHVSEGADQFDSGSQFWAAFQDLLKLLGVAVDEVVRVPADPSRHLPHRPRARCRRQVGFAAVLLDEPPEDWVAAGEAPGGDLAIQGADFDPALADAAQ